MKIEEVFAALHTGPQGLSQQEAGLRLAQGSANRIARVRQEALGLKFLRQFTHFFAILLWIAALLCFLAQALNPRSGMVSIGVAILFVILLNGGFSFLQEYKAEKTLQALQRLMPHLVRVLRSGQLAEIPAEEVVPGDILLLAEGDKVPADARVIFSDELSLNISTLTGEPLPVTVTARPWRNGQALKAKNLVYSGTYVVKGKGQAVVFATGSNTEYGRIANLAQTVKQDLGHLQKEIRHTSHVITGISVGMGMLFFALGSLQGIDVWTTLVFVLGIIVANVPEGLLPLVTLSLAIGTQRMARQNFLVRNLNVVENLGAITVIATDKTGTLTENCMEVRELFDNRRFLPASEGCNLDMARILALCNDVATGSRDPTELALVKYISRHRDLEDLQKTFPRLRDFPFDYHLRRMTTVHARPHHSYLVLSKGAFMAILNCCGFYTCGSGVEELTAEIRHGLMQRHDELAGQGYRVLALAYRETDEIPQRRDRIEQQMVFAGLVSLLDPLRAEVKEAVAKCRQAGIRLVMITGDNPLTAVAIARQAGLIDSSEAVLTGEEMERLPPDSLKNLLKQNFVFAATTPEHKLYIVSLLKEMNEVVAVTGDGVNDAPAMKRADVGIAMGSGTEVAKEVASAVLLDDHFATLVKGIEEGRAVSRNIRKFMTYILASNAAEVVPFIAYFLAPVPLALTIPQVLAIDLGTDMLPALALGTEKPESGTMAEPPRSGKERFLDSGIFLRAYAVLGLLEAIPAMGLFFGYLYAHGWQGGSEVASPAVYRAATTLTFAAIVFGQIGSGFACRSERESLWKIGWLSNRFFLAGVLCELAFLALTASVSFLQPIFGTALPEMRFWLWLLAIPPLILGLEEVRKTWLRRRKGLE